MDSSNPTVGIITVGDELLSGRVVDTHSAAIARRLVPLGYRVLFQASVGDASGELRKHLAFDSVEEPDALIITGGLGPTEDDRTRAEVAAACGDELEFREDQWQHIVAFMESRNVRASARNRHQAYFPASSVAVLNPLGTAPAFHVPRGPSPRGRRGWWVLPGVTAELNELLDTTVIPQLLQELPAAAGSDKQVLRFFDVSESRLDAWFAERLVDVGSHGYHICVSQGELEVHLPMGVDLHATARVSFPGALIGLGTETLADRVITVAGARGLTVSLAESCTGGMVASRLTDVPGASEVLKSGWVVYSNEAKSRELGVDASLIESHGAVSAEVARELADGARVRAESDRAVAITGIAGPGGGSEEKPVGTVYFALSTPEETVAEMRRFHGNRGQIRTRSASFALYLLLRSL